MTGMRAIFAIGLWTALFADAAIAEAAFQCPDPALSVEGADAEVAALACRHAAEAKAQIVACGLRQTDPIRIVLVDRLVHEIGVCLASFDCAHDVLSVTDPAAIAAALGDDSAYLALPVETVFKALIAHEMAHAMLDQSSPGVDLAFVDHEYVAAAMELEAIGPEARATLIAAAPVSLPAKKGLISVMIYAFDPRKFAVNAWHFFDAEPDGCARVREIAAGAFTFSDEAR